MTAVSYWTAAMMVIAAAALHGFGAQDQMNFCFINTTCSQNVEIPVDELCDLITVTLNFDHFMWSGASCSWVVPAPNSTVRYNVLETLPKQISPGLEMNTSACDPNVFQLWEHDPVNNSVQSPLPVPCYGGNDLATYGSVVSQLGFSLSILLNISSPLPKSLKVLGIVPLVWTNDTCPANNSKVLVAPKGPIPVDSREKLTLDDQFRYSFPPDLVCHWEITASDDDDLVMLQIEDHELPANVCSSRLTVSDKEGSPNPATFPLCKGFQDVYFDYASTTGSVFVMYESGNSSMSPVWTISYWSVDACPQTPLVLSAYSYTDDILMGTSFSSLGARRDQQCAWRVLSYRTDRVKLLRLDAADFQNCDNNTDSDYLILNGEKVGMCDSSKFPMWSEESFMDVRFHTQSQVARRSFVLRYRAVLQTACQGYRERVNITGLPHSGQSVRLPPTEQGDHDVCQWLYTAIDEDKVVQVKVNWALPGSIDEGVQFDRNTCTYSNIHAYNGNISSSSEEITPTCTEDKSAIVYTSVSREMLFVYTKDSDQSHSALSMGVSQIATSGGVSIWQSVITWKASLPGLVASMLVYQRSMFGVA